MVIARADVEVGGEDVAVYLVAELARKCEQGRLALLMVGAGAELALAQCYGRCLGTYMLRPPWDTISLPDTADMFERCQA